MSKEFQIEAYPCKGQYMSGVATLSAKPIRWSGPKSSSEDVGRRTAGDAPTVIWTLESLILKNRKCGQRNPAFKDCALWLKGRQAEIDRLFYADYP